MPRRGIRTGTLTIEYEFQAEDPHDIGTSDYLGILEVKNSCNEKLILRHADRRMLEEVLMKIHNHATT